MSFVTRYFLDTEFNESPGSLQLISIGLVDEHGREFYAISSEFEESRANVFVRQNVLPRLGSTPRESLRSIRDRLLTFVGDTRPEFWGYFADYDWVLFCWIFGTMVELPKGWPMFCMDLKQLMHEHDIRRFQLPELPAGKAHNALVDAQWLREAHSAAQDILHRRAGTVCV